MVILPRACHPPILTSTATVDTGKWFLASTEFGSWEDGTYRFPTALTMVRVSYILIYGWSSSNPCSWWWQNNVDVSESYLYFENFIGAYNRFRTTVIQYLEHKYLKDSAHITLHFHFSYHSTKDIILLQLLAYYLPKELVKQ